MSKGTAIRLGLNEAYNDLFSTQAERNDAQRCYVIDLPAAEIGHFPDHPFKVRMDESMMELADSMTQHGILAPSLVRPMPDGSYQMVSGHRRKRAAELTALPTAPCIVRELTDDEAIIIMVDSNLQREQVLPSEKAFAYKMGICSKIQISAVNGLKGKNKGKTSGGYPATDNSRSLMFLTAAMAKSPSSGPIRELQQLVSHLEG